jgi:hypothetical protein
LIPPSDPATSTALSLPLFPAFKSFALLPFLLVAFITVFVARAQNGKSSPLTFSAALVAFKVGCRSEVEGESQPSQPSQANHFADTGIHSHQSRTEYCFFRQRYHSHHSHHCHHRLIT